MLGKKTIDKAISGLTRIIADLEEIERESQVEVERLDAERARIAVRQADAERTRQHAGSIRAKISALVEE